MKKETLQGIIQETWKQMTEEEVVKKILKNKVHEQTISAHLYCKLQHDEELDGWDIHAEYNRQGTNRNAKTNKSGRRIRPDIIIHKVGEQKKHNNLLWIEMKSGTFAKEGEINRTQKIEKDIKKCEEVTENTGYFQYQHALVLVYNTKGAAKGIWFKNGEEIQES